MKYVAYTRVSKDEQAASGLGLAAQRAAIEDRHLEVAYWTEDAGLSGALPPEKRPALQRALTYARDGSVDGIVVAKLDRLTRSIKDFVMLLDQSQREGWDLVILDLGVDTSTPNGRFLAHVIASVAQLERDLISQRTKDALLAKRAAGWEHPNTTPSEVRSRIVAGFDGGDTYQAIADKLNVLGVTPAGRAKVWQPSSVRSVLIAEARVRPGTRRKRLIKSH